ncbi:peptidyl-prolyl cis-trans isomerase [Candidatus Fermentibacterales bacterium]|nr:peptidyl-prolyl cis-trans isomerase [Candidatus Fermentibacterales bacterium]
MTRNAAFKALSLPLAGLALLCSCQQSHRPEQPEGDILAVVGDVEITTETIRQELELIPPYQRASFETLEGRRVLLDHLIERELLLQAATDAGLESDSFVVAQVERAMEQVETTRKRALIQAFYEREVVDRVEIPEEEILAYYNDHVDDIYHQDRQYKVAHILLEDEATANEVLSELERGVGFDSLARARSTHVATANMGGELGWVTLGAPVPYLGDRPELARAIFAASAGDLVGPLQSDMGFHVFRIEETIEEGEKPLDEVRESIINILKPGRVNSFYRDSIIPSLWEQYGVDVNEEAFLPDSTVSADSLLGAAQSLMENSPERAIRHFELYLERFPESDKAYQAQFLIGFTCSEYLQDYERAREAFQLVIDRYPDSELTDDAQWMIENMQRPIEEILPVEEDSVEAVPEEQPETP